MKAVVCALIVKRTKDKGYLIMTQKRRVLNKVYDPLYDGTWETMGETVKEGESVISALIRGCQEEFGRAGFYPKILGGTGGIATTGKGDQILCVEPFCFVQSLGPPQPWLGPCFIVEVPDDFEPDYEHSDTEATCCKWWEPSDLKQAIEESSGNFMGLHMPALYKLCLAIKKGEV